MKDFQGNPGKEKLDLRKQTVSNLTPKELKEVKAGVCNPCWENLWTLYYCYMVDTA